MFQDSIQVLGIMSGSSLDGLDIGCFEFYNNKFKIIEAKTKKIDLLLVEKLKYADQLPKSELAELDKDYGKFIANEINRFLKKKSLIPALIGLHGHTVFHEPKNGFSLQIGNAQTVANITKINTVGDFRNKDIKLGGQGAPLVPFGDLNLFPGFDAYLNLGGIANITIPEKGIAFDITYANRALNYLANKIGFDFDKGGKFASNGKIIPSLLEDLSRISYLSNTPPKSLNNQDFEKDYLPILRKHLDVPENVLTTYNHFLVKEIFKWLPKRAKLFISGGGALNTFLITLLKSYGNIEVILPKKEIINYKEALIFGFLATKRMKEEINVISKFTGAKEDSVSGEVFYPE